MRGQIATFLFFRNQLPDYSLRVNIDKKVVRMVDIVAGHIDKSFFLHQFFMSGTEVGHDYARGLHSQVACQIFVLKWKISPERIGAHRRHQYKFGVWIFLANFCNHSFEKSFSFACRASVVHSKSDDNQVGLVRRYKFVDECCAPMGACAAKSAIEKIDFRFIMFSQCECDKLSPCNSVWSAVIS